MKYPKEALLNAKPQDLAWLAGQWRGKHGEEIIEEHWTLLGTGNLMAMFSWQRGEAIWFYEFIVIETDGKQVFLRLKHFYPELKGWEEKDLATEFILTQLSENEAVFRQVNKPNAPWMIYRLEADGRLFAYFETEDTAPNDSDIFKYERIPA